MLSNVINSRILNKAYNITNREITNNEGKSSFTISTEGLSKINRILRLSGNSTTIMCDNLINLIQHKNKPNFFVFSVIENKQYYHKIKKIQLTHLTQITNK